MVIGGYFGQDLMLHLETEGLGLVKGTPYVHQFKVQMREFGDFIWVGVVDVVAMVRVEEYVLEDRWSNEWLAKDGSMASFNSECKTRYHTYTNLDS